MEFDSKGIPMTPKEWVAENCPEKGKANHKCVTLGRGRMDQYHKQLWENKNGAPDSINKPVAVTYKPQTAVVADVKYTYPEKDFRAFARVNGKRVPVGMREACSNCYRLTHRHVSLVGHFCDDPSVSTVLGVGTEPYPVTIEPRPTSDPLPLIRW